VRRSLYDHALVYVPRVPSFELSDELDNAHSPFTGYLSNSISTSVAEWYKASVVRRFFGYRDVGSIPSAGKRTAIKSPPLPCIHATGSVAFVPQLLVGYSIRSLQFLLDGRLKTGGARS